MNRFYTTKGIGKGTGLGLATVYSIIKNHKATEILQEEASGFIKKPYKLYDLSKIISETIRK